MGSKIVGTVEKRAVDIYSKQTDRFHFLKAFYWNDGKRVVKKPTPVQEAF